MQYTTVMGNGKCGSFPFSMGMYWFNHGTDLGVKQAPGFAAKSTTCTRVSSVRLQMVGSWALAWAMIEGQEELTVRFSNADVWKLRQAFMNAEIRVTNIDFNGPEDEPIEEPMNWFPELNTAGGNTVFMDLLEPIINGFEEDNAEPYPDTAYGRRLRLVTENL